MSNYALTRAPATVIVYSPRCAAGPRSLMHAMLSRSLRGGIRSRHGAAPPNQSIGDFYFARATSPSGWARFGKRPISTAGQHLQTDEGSRPKKKRSAIMSFVHTLRFLIATGTLLWFVNRLIPIHGHMRSMMTDILVFGVVLWMLPVMVLGSFIRLPEPMFGPGRWSGQ